jgi:amidophosphoribosyltransferase
LVNAEGVHALLARRASEGSDSPLLALQANKNELQTAHCFFEWIYFANPESVLDGISVKRVRVSLGMQLALQERLPLDNNTIIVPVPNTARHAAAAMACELGVPLVDALEVNEGFHRTFIDGAKRGEIVRSKFTFRADLLSGKRVLLIEDTLIRGTTLRWLVANLRECGAAEVHVRIACPPIIAPCYYGIDIATVDELFAPRFSFRELGADSLSYLPLGAIAKAIGLPPARLCQACTTGQYPTSAGQQLYALSVRHRDGANGHTEPSAMQAPIAQRPCNR